MTAAPQKILRFSTVAAFREHRKVARRYEKESFAAFIAPNTAGWAVAVVASKAQLGNAIRRNRAKRRVRAAVARALKNLRNKSVNPCGIIVYTKNKILEAPFEEVVVQMEELLGKV